VVPDREIEQVVEKPECDLPAPGTAFRKHFDVDRESARGRSAGRSAEAAELLAGLEERILPIGRRRQVVDPQVSLIRTPPVSSAIARRSCWSSNSLANSPTTVWMLTSGPLVCANT
jgi:hypothetical protein